MVEENADIPPVLEKSPFDASSILGELATKLALIEQLRVEAQQLVDVARDAGVTWKAIGSVVGITPQSAYQMWSETGRAKHREYQQKRRNAVSEPAD